MWWDVVMFVMGERNRNYKEGSYNGRDMWDQWPSGPGRGVWVWALRVHQGWEEHLQSWDSWAWAESDHSRCYADPWVTQGPGTSSRVMAAVQVRITTSILWYWKMKFEWFWIKLNEFDLLSKFNLIFTALYSLQKSSSKSSSVNLIFQTRNFIIQVQIKSG